MSPSELVLIPCGTALLITAVAARGAFILVKTLRKFSESLSATVLTASMDVGETIHVETKKLTDELGNLSVTLGGIYDMAGGDDVKYVPLEDFMTEKLLSDAQSDFDNSELCFEWELTGG